MSLTTDPEDSRLGHGVDTEPIAQHEAYLILSEEKRAKGFVRPLRLSYRHVGITGPGHPLRDLTDEEREIHAGRDYVKYEDYQGSEGRVLGRFWTQAKLDAIGKGCGAVTTMNEAIAATYSRDPAFYGATYCCGCRYHLPVGAQGEFTWVEPDGSEAGNRVGT